jgi:hypothetical protein
MLRSRVTDVSVPVGAEPVPSPGSRRLLVSVGAACLVAAALVGYWLVAHGRGTAPPRAAAAVPADPDPVQTDALPPGPVTVTGVRSASSVRFSWDYSARRSTDTYRWEVVGGKNGVVATPTLTIPAPVGTRVCVRVIVVRADGSNATREWSPEGCVR